MARLLPGIQARHPVWRRTATVGAIPDAHTRAVLWEGSASLPLRRVAAPVGLVAPHWAPTDNPRDWHVDTIVTALLKRFGRPQR